MFLNNVELTDNFKIKELNTVEISYENNNKKLNQLILKK